MPLKSSENQMHKGPWLDRLFPIRLPGGRMLSVVQFSVVPTNIGILEGGLLPGANAMQREKILAIAKKRCGDPLFVVEPTRRSPGRRRAARA